MSNTEANRGENTVGANPFRWIEIYVGDMPRAKRFYETVFEISFEKVPAPDTGVQVELWAFPMSKMGPGASGALVKMEGFECGGTNSVIPYFGCDDCAVESARVEGAGGRIHAEKFSIGPFGFIALAFDTEGNLFGMHSIK